MKENENSALQVINGSHHLHQCWSCGDMRAEHFCQSCGKVQPAEPTDFFGFFGLERKLNIDLDRLEKEFYLLSRKLHPDVYARSTSREQSWSLEKTSQLNDAYRTLRDPISRTEYLLKLNGVQLEEQSKSATEAARTSGVDKKQAVPPDLLEEVFELNMQLEEARMNSKMGEIDDSLLEDLANTKRNLQGKQDAMMTELQEAWNRWDNGDRESIQSMIDVLNRRTYIRNLLREVNEVLEA